MKKTIAAALVLILLSSGCQNKEKPLPLEDPLDLYKEERERRNRIIRI